jgi:hypothetical protein
LCKREGRPSLWLLASPRVDQDSARPTRWPLTRRPCSAPTLTSSRRRRVPGSVPRRGSSPAFAPSRAAATRWSVLLPQTSTTRHPRSRPGATASARHPGLINGRIETVASCWRITLTIKGFCFETWLVSGSLCVQVLGAMYYEQRADNDLSACLLTRWAALLTRLAMRCSWKCSRRHSVCSAFKSNIVKVCHVQRRGEEEGRGGEERRGGYL